MQCVGCASPVHPRATALADGSLEMDWTRRSRGAWAWPDGVDAPLHEQAEAYFVTYGPLTAPAAIWDVAEPHVNVGAPRRTEQLAGWSIAKRRLGRTGWQVGKLACRQAGVWLFIAPRDGIRMLDRSNGQEKHYFAGWQAPSAPAVPSGGSTIDTEARAAIASLVAALRIAGVYPAS